MLPAAVGGSIQPASQATTCLCNYLSLKYNYVKGINKNLKELNDEAKKLYKRRDDVKNERDRDAVRTMPTNECELWIEKVGEFENEVKDIEARYKKGKKWLCGLCPFFSRANLSKDMVQMTEKARKLRGEVNLKNVIVVDKPPDPIVKMPQPWREKEIPSLQGVKEKIISSLGDDNVKRIGIWGMSGVGKTTILKRLNNNEEITQMFGIVIFLNVTKEWSVQRLQQQIMNRLKLSVEGNYNTEEIAEIISETLGMRKYLILLDDVQKEINLHDVGICDNEKGGKVVFASRFRDVCIKMESDDEPIPVKTLCEKEAWKLFREIVGDVADYPFIKYNAELVIKECGGLLKVIVVVAKSLKMNGNVHVWRDALMTLQSPNPHNFMDEVLKTLKLGYDMLEDNAEKNCFLYGALYPEDHDIYADYLMECWKAEGFIAGVEKLRDARDRGHTILEELINKSLFEYSKSPHAMLDVDTGHARKRVRYVKMPSLLRRLALTITPPNEEAYKLLVRTGNRVQETPNEEEWQETKRISLIHNQPFTLPESPNCCMLLTLLLQGNLESIPESFFGYMCSLRVLDLYNTGIERLPSTLSSLTSLRGLYLNSCSNLVELPTRIEELDNLEVLDIRRTKISGLPVEIRKLVNLKCLRFSFIDVARDNHIQETPAQEMSNRAISWFPHLEELSIDVEQGNRRWDEILDAVVQDVSALKELSSLCFYFSRIECLQNFIKSSQSWQNKLLSSFKLLVGSHDSYNSHGLDDSEYLIEKYLRFSSGEGIHPAISEVLCQTDAFDLVGHRNVQQLSDFGIENMNALKVCLIEGCDKIESINVSNKTTNAALQFLQKLDMINLPKLRSIWEEQMQSGSFIQLTTLTLKGCPELKKIFSRPMIQQFSKLQQLRIENCSGIEEIITEDENETQMCSVLPKLLNLTLVKLPKLVKICKDVLVWPSLEWIEVSSCDELKELPFRVGNAINLRLIVCNEDWWNTLQWGDNDTKGYLRSLCRFSIKSQGI